MVIFPNLDNIIPTKKKSSKKLGNHSKSLLWFRDIYLGSVGAYKRDEKQTKLVRREKENKNAEERSVSGSITI